MRVREENSSKTVEFIILLVTSMMIPCPEEIITIIFRSFGLKTSIYTYIVSLMQSIGCPAK